MADLRSSIIINLSGNLQERARRMTAGLQQLGRRGQASMRMLHSGVHMAGRGLDRLANRYTALITGAAGIGALRMIGRLEEQFTRIGIQAGRSAEEMDVLRRKIFENARMPDIQVDPGQITAAIEDIIEKTGDLDFAVANIRNIGLAMQATGGEGRSIGGILAEFQKMGLGAREAFEALDILTVQGKEGAFTLQNLAALGPRVVTAYTAMGRTGVPAIREMGAALQVIRQGTGSAEQAATAFEALLRVFGDTKKVEFLQRSGIQVFDPEALKEGREVLRPINELIVDIIQRTGGRKTMLSQVLDAEAMRAFNAVAAEFQRTGVVESIGRFYDVQADGSTITRDSERAAKTFNAALTNLHTVWQQFADDQLTEPVKRLTEYLNSLEPGTVDRWLSTAGSVAKIAGGLILAKKLGVLGAIGWGAKAAGGAALGTAAGGAALAAGKAGLLTAGGAALAAGKVALPLAGAGVAGYSIGTAANTAMGGLAGLLTGGEYGGKGWLGEMIYDALHNAPDRRSEVEGTIRLEIEGAPVRVREMRTNNRRFNLDVDSGLMMMP